MQLRFCYYCKINYIYVKNSDVIKNNGFPALERDERISGEFPENFIWAVATSSYQVCSLNIKFNLF